MRLNTFTVPLHHFELRDHGIAFRHKWEGYDLFWIVPQAYVISIKRGAESVKIRLDERYWERAVNVA